VSKLHLTVIFVKHEIAFSSMTSISMKHGNYDTHKGNLYLIIKGEAFSWFGPFGPFQVSLLVRPVRLYKMGICL
jgi:hypothetical protein